MHKHQCSTCGAVCEAHDTAKENEECNMPEKMICMADEAWCEVLKAKMKAEIEASCGEQLTQLAKLVTTTNGKRWQFKMQMKQGCEDFKKKLCEFFSSSCEKK